MQGLTQRQQMVLDFIRQSIHDRGYPPTLREIGDTLHGHPLHQRRQRPAICARSNGRATSRART